MYTKEKSRRSRRRVSWSLQIVRGDIELEPVADLVILTACAFLVNTLTQDLEQEIKISKAALAESQRQAAAMSKMTKSPGVSTSAKDVAADREQNEQIIKLYEDMTNLMVPKVNIVRGGNGGRSDVRLCTDGRREE